MMMSLQDPLEVEYRNYDRLVRKYILPHLENTLTAHRRYQPPHADYAEVTLDYARLEAPAGHLIRMILGQIEDYNRDPTFVPEPTRALLEKIHASLLRDQPAPMVVQHNAEQVRRGIELYGEGAADWLRIARDFLKYANSQQLLLMDKNDHAESMMKEMKALEMAARSQGQAR